jgi:hypothetical protein
MPALDLGYSVCCSTTVGTYGVKLLTHSYHFTFEPLLQGRTKTRVIAFSFVRGLP